MKNTTMASFNFKALKTLLVVALIYLFTGCVDGKSREPAIYILPDNYIGSFYIIYNAPKGEPSKYEDEARVYEIPDSGVLVTQMSPNEGWIDGRKLQYYYQKNDGTRTPITDRWTASFDDTPEHRKDKQLYIFGGGIGEFQPLLGCDAIEQGFGVGTKADMLDNINFFDIYDDKGIKNMDKSLFDGMCPGRDDKGDPSIYLLPENYKGTFYLFFNIAEGQAAKYENGILVFEIPSSGILMTKARPNNPWADSPKLQYYYVNNDKTRTAITGRSPLGIDDTPEMRKDKQIMISRSSIGEFVLKKGCSVHWQRISVGTKAELFDSNPQFEMNNIDRKALEASCSK